MSIARVRDYTILALDPVSGLTYHFGMASMLNMLRRRRKLSQTELAHLAHTSQPQIKRLETGERKLTREWAQRLAPHLGTTARMLLFGDQTVELVGYVGAGSEAHYYADGQGEVGRAKMPPDGGERTVAVQIRGDSLGAAFDGWVIYYDNRREPPTDDLLGQLCVVGLRSGQVLVKMLMRGRLPRHYDLFAGVTGTPMTDQAVDWAAPVTAILPPHLARTEDFADEPPPDDATGGRKRGKKAAARYR